MQEIWCSVVKKKNQFGWNHYSEGLLLMADSKVCLLYLEINWLYNNQKKKPNQSVPVVLKKICQI